jgi:hypothetical protein
MISARHSLHWSLETHRKRRKFESVSSNNSRIPKPMQCSSEYKRTASFTGV